MDDWKHFITTLLIDFQQGKWQILEVKQELYELWIENSIRSVNCRNGQQSIKISKLNYLKRYGNIINTPPLEEKLKERCCSNKTTLDITVRLMKTLVKEKCGYDISLGKLNFLKPFFVTNATKKERVLCMCKCCLNMKLKFDVIMSHIKANGGENYSSTSDFLMKCTCDRKENGFYDLKCCTANCDDCGAFSFHELPKLDTTQAKIVMIVEHFPFMNYQNLILPKQITTHVKIPKHLMWTKKEYQRSVRKLRGCLIKMLICKMLLQSF